MNARLGDHQRRPTRGSVSRPGAAVALVACLIASAPARSSERPASAGSAPLPAVSTPAPDRAADRVLRDRSQHLLSSPGATLRAAHEALDNRDREHAVWLLDQVIARHPIVADHAALMQARVLEEDERHAAAAQVARQALEAHRKSPVRSELHVLLGESLSNQGDLDGAFAAWRAALDESRDETLRARVLLSIGAAEERSGLDEEAATTYKLIWYAYPASDEARIATHRLELLESLLDRPMREASDWRRRGDRLFRKRQNQRALDAYERALELGLSRSETERARRQRAHALFRQRRYPEALEAFEGLRQKDDIPIWRARSMARAGQVPESIEAFEQIAKKNRGTLSVRARFLAALLLEGRGYDDRAERHFKAVERVSARAGMGQAAGWRLGWAAYRAQRYDEAIHYFDRLIEAKRRDAIDQLRPRYWRARALQRQGDPGAAEELAEIAREFPFSYYGWRAARLVDDDGTPLETAGISDSTGRLSPRELARPRILLEAGMTEAAGSEIRALSKRAKGLSERLELAHLATDVGDYHRAQRLVVDPYSESLARGPIPRLEELWWYAWPSAYAEMVDEATSRPGSVDAELVYSIMREESGYRASVVSPVGARGLLQIMTTTGERLARSTGLETFRADDLFEPRTNIGLGAYYLGELSERWDGRLSSSIASYNAGPEAVSEWPRAASTSDDEWVESIPYDQTRSYVKRVLRSLHAYRVLY